MKKEADLPPEFVAKCKAVTNKRARIVIDHVLKHGSVTTQELKNVYGYDHPPRAKRDVVELGIPMELFWVKGADGRKIGAYKFGDLAKVRGGKFSGRTVLNKRLRNTLLARDGARCAIYREAFPAAKLQIDHRVPFEVAGDDASQDVNPDNYMLLCVSANRAKGWSCEHCRNGMELKNSDICVRCYWAYPDDYDHVAMEQIRRLDLIWVADEVADYDSAKHQAEAAGQDMPHFVKNVLRRIQKSS